jgi:hypothetical protein
MSTEPILLQVFDGDGFVDPTSTDPWLTERQAAEILGLSPTRLKGMRRRGDAPVYIQLPNGDIRYRPRALWDWIRLEREYFHQAQLRLQKAVSGERRRRHKAVIANRSGLRIILPDLLIQYILRLVRAESSQAASSRAYENSNRIVDPVPNF